MCGIAGAWAPRHGFDPAAVAAMGATLAHRGPDADDTWIDREAGLGLAFRRLAIIDLSPAGMQPMVSASGRYVVVFNGEIYRYRELRDELSAGHAWRGSSDTEVMLAAFDRWGVRDGIARLDGMFALAVWDRHEQVLTLARDRFGEKPLYYGCYGGTLLFGSELKALRAHPAFDAGIDRDSLVAYAFAGYVPSPRTIHERTWKLPPACTVRLRAADLDASGLPVPVPYWSLRSVVATAGPALPDGEAVGELDRVLRDAVARTMISDVPLGAFLSGGIDSSTVVALMQAQSSLPVRTFTVGFPGVTRLDESEAAAAVARHLRTDHTTLDVTADDARVVIPRLATMYDEPFADQSQIPTHLVAALARRHVTVALSGDGGDELFGGYSRYLRAPTLARTLGRVPGALQAPSRRTIAAVGRALPRAHRGSPGSQLQRVAALLPARTVADFHRRAFAVWPEGSDVVVGRTVSPSVLFDRVPEGPSDPVAAMMFADAHTYLPDDICAKVDRAAMAVSLETRMPFLDRRVAEFAWTLTPQQRIRHGKGKWLVRQVLQRYVPPSLFERPKAGFGLPLDEWLRGPLATWAGDLLSPAALRADGWFDPAVVAAAWDDHRSGRRQRTEELWAVLMFQAWLHA